MQQYNQCAKCNKSYTITNPPTVDKNFNTMCQKCQVVQMQINGTWYDRSRSNSKLGHNYALIECLQYIDNVDYYLHDTIIQLIPDIKKMNEFYEMADKHDGAHNIQMVMQLPEDVLDMIFNLNKQKIFRVMIFINSLINNQSDFLVQHEEDTPYYKVSSALQHAQKITEKGELFRVFKWCKNVIACDKPTIPQPDREEIINAHLLPFVTCKAKDICEIIQQHFDNTRNECDAYLWQQDNKEYIFLNLSVEDQMLDYALHKGLNGIQSGQHLMSRIVSNFQFYQGFLKSDIKSASNNIQWGTLFKICKEKLSAGLFKMVQLLYQPKLVNGFDCVIGQGIFFGQLSSQQLLSIVIKYILDEFVRTHMLNPVDVYSYVDDILIGIYQRQVHKTNQILNDLRNTFAKYGLTLNDQKTGVYVNQCFTFIGFNFITSCKQHKQLPVDQRMRTVVQYHDYAHHFGTHGSVKYCNYCD